MSPAVFECLSEAKESVCEKEKTPNMGAIPRPYCRRASLWVYSDSPQEVAHSITPRREDWDGNGGA